MLSAIFDPFQPLRPSLKGRPSLAAMAVALVATSPAYAAGSGMPWEAPLQKILDSIEGPVAKMVAVYNAQGRDDEAETLYRRALTARERVLGPGASRHAHQREQSGNAVFRAGPLWRGRAALSARFDGQCAKSLKATGRFHRIRTAIFIESGQPFS